MAFKTISMQRSTKRSKPPIACRVAPARSSAANFIHHNKRTIIAKYWITLYITAMGHPKEGKMMPSIKALYDKAFALSGHVDDNFLELGKYLRQAAGPRS